MLLDMLRHVRCMTRKKCHWRASLVWAVICVVFTTLGYASGDQRYTEMDSTQARIIRAVEARAERLSSFAEQLRMVELALDAHNSPAHLPLVVNLILSLHELAATSPTRKESLERVHLFVKEYEFDGFSKVELSYIDFMLARFSAYDGYINDSEAALLNILSRPTADVDEFTRTSAHYMAAYASYYTDQLERATYHARKSAEGFYKLGNLRGALEGYDGTSTTFYKMGKIDSALHYARKGLALADRVDEGSVQNLYLNYAEALSVIGQRDSAFYYANLANGVSIKGGRDASLARSQLCLANIYNRFGNRGTAIDHYERAIRHFDNSNEVYHAVDGLDSLAMLYAEVGNYEQAYSKGLRAFRLRDSLRQERVRRDADKLVAEYERDALAKELKASQDERALAQAVLSKRRVERLAAFGIVMSLILLVGFIYYRATSRKRVTLALRKEVEARTAELREHSDRLERQTRRLQQSNAELERFAYIASHDLKTPLRNVTSFLGLIERRLPPEAKAMVAEYLHIATTNARQMHELVTDVLEFSRLNLDVEELAEEVSVASTVAGVSVAMQAELASRGGSIRCDGDCQLVLPKGTLDQILSNLISNALKYNESPQPEAHVVVTDMEDRVRISVSDNGIGIDEEYHERVFEVFRRLHTSDQYSGTGVGLAACRKMVLRLGGTITLESVLGFGSTFTVDLPQDIREVDQHLLSAKTA